jgi:DNA-binding MarR family transcriptional regulator
MRLAALFDLQAVDLTPNQMLALQLVRSAPDGRLKAGEVAELLGISAPAATALVDRLAGAGVVARYHGEDRRVVWIALTAEGERLLADLTAGLERRVEAAISSGDDAATLDALIAAMRGVASLAGRLAEPVGPVSRERSGGTGSHAPP